MTRVEYDCLRAAVKALTITEIGSVKVEGLPLANRGNNKFQYRVLSKFLDAFSIEISKFDNKTVGLKGLQKFQVQETDKQSSVECIKVPSNWGPYTLVAKLSNNGFISLCSYNSLLTKIVQYDEVDTDTQRELNSLLEARKEAFLKRCEALVQDNAAEVRIKDTNSEENSWGF